MGRKRSDPPEVNAGSMADIAFLLLIFFLVTTTIVEDKGITVKLPPWSEEDPDITKLKSRNVFAVLVNAQNDFVPCLMFHWKEEDSGGEIEFWT